MQPLQWTILVPLDCNTGIFNLKNVNPNLFGLNFSTIQQFLKEIESSCENFKEVKKLDTISKVFKYINIALFIALIIFIVIRIIINISQYEVVVINWAFIMIFVLIGIFIILQIIRHCYYRNFQVSTMQRLRSNIDNVITKYKEFFNACFINTTYNIILDWNFRFSLVICFTCLGQSGAYSQINVANGMLMMVPPSPYQNTSIDTNYDKQQPFIHNQQIN